MSRKWAVARSTVGLLTLPAHLLESRRTPAGTVRAAQMACAEYAVGHALTGGELRDMLEMLGLFRQAGELEMVNLDRTDYGKVFL